MTPSAGNAMRSRRSVFLKTRLDAAPPTIKYFVFLDFLSRVPSWRMLRFSILLHYTRQAEATLHGDRIEHRPLDPLAVAVGAGIPDRAGWRHGWAPGVSTAATAASC
jgi:hypothetical protein